MALPSMAMQRTTFSPRCCWNVLGSCRNIIVPDPQDLKVLIELTATSSTSFWPPLIVVKALRIGGSFAVSNLTVTESIKPSSFSSFSSEVQLKLN